MGDKRYNSLFLERIYRPGTLPAPDCPGCRLFPRLLKILFRIAMKSINKHIWKFTALAAVDATVFGLTNARSVSSLGLMAGFLLLLATLYYLAGGLLSFIKVYGIKIRHKRRAALIITGLVGGLAALQSVGGLNSLDLMVLGPLVIIGYVYGHYGPRGARAVK